MQQLAYDDNWPELWKYTFIYDSLELWGSRKDLGYSYQYRNRHQWILNAVEELLPSGSEILDVAGASGNFTLPLAEKGYRLTWNDLRIDMAGLVQKKYEFGQIDYVPGNIFELADTWAGRFDGVLATEVIEHFAHPDQFLQVAAKILKPGGFLFLSTPNGRYFRFNLPRFSDCPDPSAFEAVQFKPNSDGHIFLLDIEECRMLGDKAGLRTERIDLMSNPLTRGHVKLGKLLPYLPESLVLTLESGTRKLPRPLRDKLHCQMTTVMRKPAASAH
ncbi:class I SAM-dependent methyltransferase [Acidicapsa dinghuensis]|uniref:Class I SAM-dependent methyltransferase n=1 Tax=Acidicapsa dinghuensis TaxID=2218256 RepID=A0ABW1EJC8_9BACT|nr:methyltransferase domain-containing protein [Acidicapsa dinghuensis]